MRVFVTGASGQLGQDVCRELERRGIPCTGVSSKELDIADAEAVHAMLSGLKPDAIIHCAAYTKVDQAERDVLRCWQVNAEGTRSIALAARELGTKLLYISTDYVFRGDGDRFYEVDDDLNPQNVYGLSKLAGELAVRALTEKFFIVRAAWAFGPGRSNFVRSLLRASEGRSEIPVVNDQVGSPTYTRDLAGLVCDMIVTERYGVYHATNEGVCSRDEFAEEIFRVFDRPVTVRPVSSAEFVRPAARPLNSRLSKKSLRDAGFTPLPDWHDALLRYAAELREKGEV